MNNSPRMLRKTGGTLSFAQAKTRYEKALTLRFRELDGSVTGLVRYGGSVRKPDEADTGLTDICQTYICQT